MKKLWQNYNLSIVLLLMFISAWVLQTITVWQEFVAEQAVQAESAQVFGSHGYIWSWLRATFENWQSEFLQLFTMVVLTSIFIHKGSAESRDSQDEMQQKLDEIQKELQALRNASSQKD